MRADVGIGPYGILPYPFVGGDAYIAPPYTKKHRSPCVGAALAAARNSCAGDREGRPYETLCYTPRGVASGTPPHTQFYRILS